MNLRLRCFLVLLLFCLLGPALAWQHARAENVAPDQAAYWAMVRQTRQEIIAFSSKSSADVHTALLNIAVRWEQVHQVRLEDGSLLNVEQAYWLKQFRAEKPDLTRLVMELNVLIATQDIPTASLPAASLDTLHQILARPEFQWQQQTPAWIQDMIDRLLQWLARILGQRRSISFQGNLAIQALGVLAAVLVTVALVFILRRLIAEFSGDSILNPENGAFGNPLNAKAALARAEDLSGQGDYRSAVRYLYLSALLILDERGLLFYDRTRTNRQYLRDLASRPQTASLLRAVIDVFDRVWYGFQPLDAESYRRYTEQVNQLKEQK